MKLIFANFTKPPVSLIDKIGSQIIKQTKTVSRISYKPDVLPFAIKSELITDLLKQVPATRTSWQDCCEHRVAELEKVKGRVYLMWSGGIDSSVAITSILKFGSAGLKARVTVVLSTNSYYEFPELFQLLCKNFPFLNVYYSPDTYLQEDDLLVTGELGDQLFGSDFIYNIAQHFGENAILENYKEFVPRLFSKLVGADAGQTYFENLEPIVNESPFPIKNCHDFFWWWNFTQKWQHVKFRVLCLNVIDSKKFANNVTSFFDTVPFQVWSLTHHSEKIKKDLNSYKWTAKDFIIQNTGFESYRNKPKIGSLKSIAILAPKKLGLYEDFSVMKREDLDQYIKN